MPTEQFAAPPTAPDVVVVGDVMIDDNLHLEYGGTAGPAAARATLGDSRMNLGGAGNVAANVASLGVSTALVGMVGDDAQGGRVQAATRNRLGLHPYLFVADRYRTPRKLRLYDRHAMKLLIDDEGTPLSYYATRRGRAPLQPTPTQVVDHLTEAGAKVVVTVDHGKGFLLDDASDGYPASTFQKWLRTKSVPVIVDPKPGLNWPYIGGRNVILKMNHEQLHRVVGDTLGTAWPINGYYLGPAEAREHFNRVRADILTSKAIDCDWLWLTYGHSGMSIGPMTEDWCVYLDSQPGVFLSLPDMPVDATGCGDTCSAVMAYHLAKEGYTRATVLKGFVAANHAAVVASRHLGCHVMTRTRFEELLHGAAATEDLARVLDNFA